MIKKKQYWSYQNGNNIGLTGIWAGCSRHIAILTLPLCTKTNELSLHQADTAHLVCWLYQGLYDHRCLEIALIVQLSWQNFSCQTAIILKWSSLDTERTTLNNTEVPGKIEPRRDKKFLKTGYHRANVSSSGLLLFSAFLTGLAIRNGWQDRMGVRCLALTRASAHWQCQFHGE